MQLFKALDMISCAKVTFLIYTKMKETNLSAEYKGLRLTSVLIIFRRS